MRSGPFKCYNMYMKARNVCPISKNLAKEFVAKYHYAKGMHNGPTAFGVFRPDDTLCGVVAFATPCSENVRSSIFGKEYKDRVTELHRVALLDDEPANMASWSIARAMALLKERKPYLWACVSFADASQGHVGYIYQALNAIYYGTSGKARFYLDQDNRLRHPRQNGVNISLEDAKQRGWQPVKREGKHRYLLLMPDNRSHKKWMLNNIFVDSQPYPKLQTV